MEIGEQTECALNGGGLEATRAGDTLTKANGVSLFVKDTEGCA